MGKKGNPGDFDRWIADAFWRKGKRAEDLRERGRKKDQKQDKAKSRQFAELRRKRQEAT